MHTSDVPKVGENVDQNFQILVDMGAVLKGPHEGIRALGRPHQGLDWPHPAHQLFLNAALWLCRRIF